MNNKVEINQENYSTILDIVKNSTSRTDAVQKLGWGKSSTQVGHLTKLLDNNNFDFSFFVGKKLKTENSAFNNEQLLTKITLESNSYADICRAFNIKSSGRTVETLKKYLDRFNISMKHFDRTKRFLDKNYSSYRKNEEIFIENSPVETSVVKDRILKQNLIPYICNRKECSNTGMWHGIPMTLQLEHKNGNNRDHRLENLCFLCPNCHSITATWGAKNIKGKKAPVINNEPRFMVKLERDKENFLNNIINECNYADDIFRYYEMIGNSENRNGLKAFLEGNKNENVIRYLERSKVKAVNYPEVPILIEMLKTKTYVQIGKELGCSDNAIRKHLKA